MRRHHQVLLVTLATCFIGQMTLANCISDALIKETDLSACVADIPDAVTPSFDGEVSNVISTFSPPYRYLGIGNLYDAARKCREINYKLPDVDKFMAELPLELVKEKERLILKLARHSQNPPAIPRTERERAAFAIYIEGLKAILKEIKQNISDIAYASMQISDIQLFGAFAASVETTPDISTFFTSKSNAGTFLEFLPTSGDSISPQEMAMVLFRYSFESDPSTDVNDVKAHIICLK